MNRYFCYFLFIVAIVFPLETMAQTKRALLVGISDYPSAKLPALSWSPIHGCNDVSLLTPTLKQKGFVVETLLNEKATATGIRKTLTALQAKASKGDVIYIHFSGHGQPVEDVSGDEKDGWDEALIPYDAYKAFSQGIYEGQNHILDDELAVNIDVIRKKVGPSGFVYVVIDACHAGGSSRGEEDEEDTDVFVRGTNSGFSQTQKRFAPRIDTRAHITLTPSKKMSGVCYIEACRSYQSNVEIRHGQAYYGPLSFYVNNVLGKQASLTSDTGWIIDVQKQMTSDNRLNRQNIVIEKSK